MKPSTLLSAADDFGVRWSYDHTVQVRGGPTGYTVRDEVTRTNYTGQSLDRARQIVRQILDARPQVDWLRSWKRHGAGTSAESWQLQSADGRTQVWVERVADNWWSIEIDILREGTYGRHYGWRVDGWHPAGMVKAQAVAWASHRALNEDSP